jgi:hypothetical protein
MLLVEDEEVEEAAGAGAGAGAVAAVLAAGAGAAVEPGAVADVSAEAFLLLRLFFEELPDWSLLMLSAGAALSLFIVESPDGAALEAPASAVPDFLCFFDFLVEVSSAAAVVPLAEDVSALEVSDFLRFFDFLLDVEVSLAAGVSVDVAFVAD